MNKSFALAAVALCLTAPAALLAADTPAAEKSAPDGKTTKRVEKRMRILHDGDEKDLPKETVTFLGVQTMPVDPALNAQLGLKRGMGLIVREVVDASPAAAVLKEHDVLLKLNDQWLITERQLAVLIQSYNEGDEIGLTFVRGGKEQSTKVKLGKKERVKMAMFEAPVPHGGAMRWTEKLDQIPGMPAPEAMRDHLRVLGEMHGGEAGGQQMRDVIIRRATPGPARISIMRMPQAVMMFRDNDGAVELKNEDGRQLLEVRDPAEKILFSGDVSTPELREKLDAKIKARLELVEARDTLDFVPDEEFSVEQHDAVAPGGMGAEKINRTESRRLPGNPVMRL